jgi:hypothetical protein
MCRLRKNSMNRACICVCEYLYIIYGFILDRDTEEEEYYMAFEEFQVIGPEVPREAPQNNERQACSRLSFFNMLRPSHSSQFYHTHNSG